MPDDGANDRADPTSATAAARDIRVFATAGASRLSLGALLWMANLRDRALHSIDESNGEHQPVALYRRRRAVIALYPIELGALAQAASTLSPCERGASAT
jgi:hypothetical protein